MPSCLLLQLLSQQPFRGAPGFTCTPPATGRSPPLRVIHSILTSLALFRYLSAAILFLLSTPAESPFLRKDVLRGFNPILHPVLLASQTRPSELQLLPHYPVENWPPRTEYSPVWCEWPAQGGRARPLLYPSCQFPSVSPGTKLPGLQAASHRGQYHPHCQLKPFFFFPSAAEFGNLRFLSSAQNFECR